jgi:hypothetical protein
MLEYNEYLLCVQINIFPNANQPGIYTWRTIIKTKNTDKRNVSLREMICASIWSTKTHIAHQFYVRKTL